MRTGQTSAFVNLTGRAEEHAAIILAYQQVFSSFLWTKRVLEGLIAITIVMEILLLGICLIGEVDGLIKLSLVITSCLLVATGIWWHRLCGHPPQVHHVAKLYWQFDLLPIDENNLVICDPLRDKIGIEWPTLDPKYLLKEAQRLTDISGSLEAEIELLKQLHRLVAHIQSTPYFSLKAGILSSDEPLCKMIIQSAGHGFPLSQEWQNLVCERTCANQGDELVQIQEMLSSLVTFCRDESNHQEVLRRVQNTLDSQKQQSILHLCEVQSSLVATHSWMEMPGQVEEQYDMMTEVENQVISVFDQVCQMLEDEIRSDQAKIIDEKDSQKTERDNWYNQQARQEARQYERARRQRETEIKSLKEELQRYKDKKNRLHKQIRNAQAQLTQLTDQPPTTPVRPSTSSVQRQVVFAAERDYLFALTNKSINECTEECKEVQSKIKGLRERINQHKRLIRLEDKENRQRATEIEQERQEDLKNVEESKRRRIKILRDHIERLKETRINYLAQVSTWQKPLQASGAVSHTVSQHTHLNQEIVKLRQQAIETLHDQCATQIIKLQSKIKGAIQWLAKHRVARNDLPTTEAVLIPVWVVTFTPWNNNGETCVKIITPSRISLAPPSFIRKILIFSRVQRQGENSATRPWVDKELISFILNSPKMVEKVSSLQDEYFLRQLEVWITERWQRAGWIHKSLSELMIADIERKLHALSPSFP